MDFYRKIGNEKIEDLLKKWILANPFFSEFYSRTTFIKIEDEKKFPSIGVRVANNFIQCLYNPKFIDSLKSNELETVMVHEVMHLIHRHMARVGHKNPTIWNYATDAAINQNITENVKNMIQSVYGKALKLPKMKDEHGKSTTYEGITPEYVIKEICKREKYLQDDIQRIGNKEAEVIYEYLLEYMKNPPDKSIEVSIGASGKGAGKGQQQGGKNGPSQTQKGTKVGFDVHIENIGTNEDDMKQMIEDIVNSARNKGNIPGGMDELLNRIKKPKKTGWIKKIKTAIFGTRFKGFENSYKKYNKKNFSPFIIETPTKIYSDNFTVAIDTSGSISSSDLEDFMGVIDYLSRTSIVTVIQCDTQVYENKVFKYKKRGDWRKIKVHGRGGTEFKPVFEYLKKKKMLKGTLVYLTDAGVNRSDYDFDHYGVDTVWVLTKEHCTLPPWGKVVTKAIG